MSDGPDDTDDDEDTRFDFAEESLDREGDPFADLGPDTTDGDRDGGSTGSDNGTRVDDLGPDRERGAESAVGGNPEPGTPGADIGEDVDPTDPFGEQDPRGDPFESGDMFQREGEATDTDAVWERLAEMGSGEGVGVTADGPTYAEVSKHSYCEQCPHFSEPPDVECRHGEAEIVGFLDTETVRLLNCPIVAERQALRDE